MTLFLRCFYVPVFELICGHPIVGLSVIRPISETSLKMFVLRGPRIPTAFPTPFETIDIHHHLSFFLPVSSLHTNKTPTSAMSNTDRNNERTRTILRIKRRIHEEPLPYLRLEGLNGPKKRQRGEDQQLSELMQSNASLNENSSEYASSKKQNTKSYAVWKLMKPESGVKQERSYRIVDALLEDDGPKTKRRKLTVLETSSQTELVSDSTVKVKRKTPLKVLDPLSRLVDDSLQEVHTGNKPVSDHYRFIRTDPRLAHHLKIWVAWSHSSGGNLLHACAMWNDLEIASQILQQDISLTEAVDGDGRTPYELAQLSGHDSVCQVLEAFGGDTTNYVYDIFYLDDSEIPEEANEIEDNPIASVELSSGVGYWTPLGELVLEAPAKHQASLDHFFDEDGDIDSNCEEYGGNDYPEEDANDDDDDGDSWGEAFTPDQGYRCYPLDDDFNALDQANPADFQNIEVEKYPFEED